MLRVRNQRNGFQVRMQVQIHFLIVSMQKKPQPFVIAPNESRQIE